MSARPGVPEATVICSVSRDFTLWWPQIFTGIVLR